jgi:hypothetical protein
MGDNIRLHPKYGVNPAVSACVVCGKEWGVVLFGANSANGGKEAPHRIPYGFCDQCQKAYDAGAIFLIEVRDGEKEPNPFRTGRLFGVKRDAIKHIYPDLKEERFLFIEQSMVEKIMPPETLAANPLPEDRKKDETSKFC